MPPDYGDLFGDIFGNRGRPKRNPDGQINIEISLLEAYEGMNYHINFPGEELAIKIAPGTRNGAKLRLQVKPIDVLKTYHQVIYTLIFL